MKVLSVNQMQKAERDCSQFGISLSHLMENAGKGVAEEIRNILGDIQKQTVLVVVGPGNNGGDGLVAARYLHDWGAMVNVYLCSPRPDSDKNLQSVQQRGIPCLDADHDVDLTHFGQRIKEVSVILDAVFGTGTSRPITDIYSQILAGINDAKNLRPQLRVIALDLPSGLDADTGNTDPVTPNSDYTITLGFPKLGLFNLPGSEKAGKISVVDIGIPPQLVNYVNIEFLTGKWVKSILPKRPLVSHKGTFGKVMALTGSINYLGAAYLACCGCIRVGAGLSTLAIAQSLLPILAAKLTEVTFLPLPESSPGVASLSSKAILEQQLPGYDVFLVGCGIGQHPETIKLVESILLNMNIKLPPLIMDADGLSILSKTPGWKDKTNNHGIFTPHAGELSRLLEMPIEEITRNRIAVTQQAAVEWNKTVVLKGAYTVIAAPDKRVRISPFANPGLASAGTGDVLAGTIAGMVAQGLSLFDAASCGVFLHGQAGELVRNDMGDSGGLASDLLPRLPITIRQLKAV
jgi:ADP-dependent NAD(P)H-hydrate dehydratase / NAD(P)H-hydrate epimerase